MNQETKQCKNCKQNFAVDTEDLAFYEKMQVPPPTACPECRQQRRMLFRNFKTLYKRNSDRSLKPFISMYSQQKPYKVYTHDEWWSDDWDAKSFGRSFDFNRPFFEQFQELLLAVPRFGVSNVQSQNCEYSNFVAGSKDCYLVFGTVEDEDCAYGHIVWECKDSFDNLYLYKSELCYECVDCLGSYRLSYCHECENCNDSIGLFDCRSCNNCIGCVGLKQKSYYLFNEPVGKEGYEQFMKEHPMLDAATVKLILSRQAELRKQVPQRHAFGSYNNDVSGDHIYHARNVHCSFDIKSGEDSRYGYTVRKIVGSHDISFTVDIEASYFVLTAGKANRVMLSHLCFGSSDACYCDICFDSHNVFGCAGLRNGEYCILNKQYSKAEYEDLRAKIVTHMKKTGEWGEFFPASLSPFCYNESIANEYMPLTKDEALAQGFRWNDEMPGTVGQETIANDALPADPQSFTDELAKHVLKCDQCVRNYRLIPKELSFYKRMNLPIPRHCFNCRHARRMDMRNSRHLWPGKCAKCGNGFETSYAPAQQKEFKIYCESCYQAEMG